MPTHLVAAQLEEFVEALLRFALLRFPDGAPAPTCLA